ncbi:Crp/Fnr family transcriptional regulator [Pseudobutyrivibrio sp.]|uniref:Crp/Fnr family transcriptional regulator n=1 Tax=Pseudobutyrivibrio sp. TaxID=2014367 RepID=UPI001D4A9035|nr:Crp/Fnr family transcriptional regulator [Pseudobutyrivibrio sp.]MBE5911868.1 Crp/Fnr family transcriptional regulator [Pseudobutyrivibrio sp.]
MSLEENFSRIMELQNSLPKKQSDTLNKLLSNAPRWVLESTQVVTKKKNTIFVEENTPADTVYILVDGTVRAIDYRIRGVVYDYMWFHAIKVFGSMEIFFEIPLYMTTLKTVTDCTMLVMSRASFDRWIWDDKNALRMEVARIGDYLLEESRNERVILFLQGVDRIIYLLTKNYEADDPKDEYIVGISRQELAERSGFSIKTVNRAVQKLQEDGFIGRKGRRIVISKEQYVQMKDYLTPIVANEWEKR